MLTSLLVVVTWSVQSPTTSTWLLSDLFLPQCPDLASITWKRNMIKSYTQTHKKIRVENVFAIQELLSCSQSLHQIWQTQGGKIFLARCGWESFYIRPLHTFRRGFRFSKSLREPARIFITSKYLCPSGPRPKKCNKHYFFIVKRCGATWYRNALLESVICQAHWGCLSHKPKGAHARWQLDYLPSRHWYSSHYKCSQNRHIAAE